MYISSRLAAEDGTIPIPTTDRCGESSM